MNVPKITIHPTIYGNNNSFILACSSMLPAINFIPKTAPTSTVKTTPIANNILYI